MRQCGTSGTDKNAAMRYSLRAKYSGAYFCPLEKKETLMARTAPPSDHPVYDEIAETFVSYEGQTADVSFAPLFDRHLKVLSVIGDASVFTHRDLRVTVWSGGKEGATGRGEEPAAWVRATVTEDGEVQEFTFRADEEIPLDDEEEEIAVAVAVEMLVQLLNLAMDTHGGLSGAALVKGYVQLNKACMEGAREWEQAQEEMFGGFDDEDDDHSHSTNPHGEDWHRDVDAFTEQCRYGFLHRIAVQESPYGAADISALIHPPGIEDLIPVKVFMHQGELETIPGHWYSAGEMMCPAHGQDVDIVGLVASFPVESQAFIAHSLEHLHTISHLVADILQERAADIFDILEPIVESEDELKEMGRRMFSSVLADTIAGLNGIARLHTGAAEPVSDDLAPADPPQN